MNKKRNADRAQEELASYHDMEPVEPEFHGMEYERYEIIEGMRYDFLSAPIVAHQKITAAFHILLYQACHTNGTFLFSPIDVYLDQDNQFQPDLVFILHEREHIIKEKRIEGAPDLVIEILSPSTSQNDKIRKKRQYERFRVKEYWIADPTHRTVDQFILTGDRFALHETFGVNDHLTSPLFPCIRIDLSRVFTAPREL